MTTTGQTWKLNKEVALEIIDLALTHIKKVELNPEVKTDGDNFDYWNAVKLDNGNFIDYNVCMMDDCGEINTESGEFEYHNPSKWSWDCSAYAVDPPKEEGGFHQINTDLEHYLFKYENGNANFE